VLSFSLLFLNMLANDILTPLIGPIWASL